MLTNVSSALTSAGYIYGKNNTLPADTIFSLPSVETPEKITGMSASDKSSQLLAIAREYDVTNISANELAEMGNKLYEGGHISFEEQTTFLIDSLVCASSERRAALEKLGVYLPDPDTPRNYLESVKNQLEMGLHPNRQCLENDIKIVALFEKLADLHRKNTLESFQTLGEIQTNPSGRFLR